MCIIYFGTLDNTFTFCTGCPDWHDEVFFAHKKMCLRSLGIHCPPLINLFCGTSPLMRVILVGAVCDLCVRSARPSAFFSRSSSTSSSTPQLVAGKSGDDGERRCYLVGQEDGSWEVRVEERPGNGLFGWNKRTRKRY